MDKHHEPKKIEKKIYSFWQKKGLFKPDKLKGKPYTIVLPPPNVTGSLHLGHTLNATCQDIIIRQKRMQGFKALWLPGTDHAGIATQNVVEKNLKKRGLTRFDLGREKFIKEVWEWKKQYGNIIFNQYKKLGVSCDWSRARFTMDKEYAKEVKKAFLHYYKKGWIYQANRAINWCPRCLTSLSDLELEYKEEKTNLWYIKYPIKNSKEFIIVATTRPETMLGDTAVAVNPKDERYKKFTGKKVILPLQNKEIPIVQDRLIDMSFGTGAVKITPAHDLNDEKIGKNHNLESIQVISEKALMTENCPKKYQGLKTLIAREEIIKDLEKLNLLEKIQEYTHSVPKCYRCNSTVEVILSLQWFLKMQELALKAIKPIEKKEIIFFPKNFEKTYLAWLKNIKDWCISRQIWWGHKIPIKGETDVLDTWFSSALWPFATLNKKDFKTFYPTNSLFTARDIINLWVSRMIFSS
ncbi:MAG: valine--tRNA ligase, partial [Candidatus Pacebacteria bacterium]|nr:valine--tRNA ligase [Candidatus Paceibacterota bacterium]